MSRVFAAIRGLGWMANAVGFSLAGFLVERFSPRGVYKIAAIAELLYGLIPLLFLRRSDVNESDPVGGRVGSVASTE